MKFIQQKIKMYFNGGARERKDAPGHTLRTSKTSCKVFRGVVSVCANCLHVCVTLCVPRVPCTVCFASGWKILRPYFDFIKAFVHITGQDTFCDNKILHEKRKTDDIKNGATQYKHKHTRTHTVTCILTLAARQIDRAKLINCKLPVEFYRKCW